MKLELTYFFFDDLVNLFIILDKGKGINDLLPLIPHFCDMVMKRDE